MKKLFLALTAALVFAGCTATNGNTTGTTDASDGSTETDTSSADYRDFGVAVERLTSLTDMVLTDDGDLRTGKVTIEKWKENMVSALNSAISTSTGAKAKRQRDYDEELKEFDEFEKKYSEISEPSEDDESDMEIKKLNLKNAEKAIAEVESITNRCEKLLPLIDVDNLTAEDVLDEGGQIYHEVEDLFNMTLWY